VDQRWQRGTWPLLYHRPVTRLAAILMLTLGCRSTASGPADGASAVAADVAAPASDRSAPRDAAAPADLPVFEVAPPGAAFPAGFVFGAAIAGFQADMGCPTLPRAECDDPNSDWYVFTTTPEIVADQNAHLSGQNPAVVGPGFWELYPEDIRRAREELHHGALRFSLEWSRIFPTATDGVEGHENLRRIASAPALARYHAILAELKRRQLRPLVTLYHYALPTWIHDARGCHARFADCSPRGWVDDQRTVREIQKFAAFCAEEFGAEVDWWATLNEPLQNVLFGYVQPGAARAHPPAVSLQSAAAKSALHALIAAHARMYDAVKAGDRSDADGDGKPSWIGVVYPLVPIAPASDFALDVQAARDIDYLWNRAYLNAVVKGKYDENLDGKTVDRDDLAGRMDYVGVNWYGGISVGGLGFSLLPALSPKFTANPLSFKETPNQPEKLAEFLRWVNVELGLPAVITENGAADPADDGSAPRFLVRNLKAISDAIAAGADVRGYFYWTLTDNFEWNHGMNIRMGLYGVSKDDPMKRRTPRRAVAVFEQIARWHLLPDALVDQYR
jgi:beta-galactosidase